MKHSKTPVFSQNLELLSGLSPEGLWYHFSVLCDIARESKNETAIADYIMELAQSKGYSCERDSLHNLVVYVPATLGYEDRPPICLQSHIDMVCLKDDNVESVFPITLQRGGNSGNILRATGTTLGADNGIGVAGMMTLMVDKTIPHVALELLFTTQEEIGLVGAEALDSSWITSKQIINLDSEEEGIIFVGCAGGGRIIGTFENKNLSRIHSQSEVYQLSVKNFKGGHSGTEIHLGHGNAISVLADLIKDMKILQPSIISFEGGSVFNAIPTQACARIAVAFASQEYVERMFNDVKEKILEKFPKENPVITLEKLDFKEGDCALLRNNQDKFLAILTELPHGVITMEPGNPELVQTSNNLAMVRMEGNNFIVTCMYRSSSVASLDSIKKAIKQIFEINGGRTNVQSSYPAWEPRFDSVLLSKLKKACEKTLSKNVDVRTIHAGLECASLSQLFPDAEIVSFGPEMGDVHTTSEWVDIDSVQRFWTSLCAVLVD